MIFIPNKNALKDDKHAIYDLKNHFYSLGDLGDIYEAIHIDKVICDGNCKNGMDCNHDMDSRDTSNIALNQDDITHIVKQVIVFTFL